MSSAGRSWPRALTAGALSCMMAVLDPSGAAAQWHLEMAAGGVSHRTAGAAVSTSSAFGSLRYEGPRWLYVSGGLPFGSEGLPWAAGGAGARLLAPLGGIEVGADFGGHAHGYRVPSTGQTGSGIIVDALPFVAGTLAGARIEARTGLTHYSSRFAGETISRTGHDSGVSADFRPHQRLSVSGEGRLFRAAEDEYPYLGAAAELIAGEASIWAHVGRWTSDLLPDPAWGAGAVFRVGGPYTLRASYQQEPTDPIFWNETRRFWSVGVSRRFGARRPVPLLDPVLPEMSRGGVVFRVPADGHPKPPTVAGDFNGWVPVEMTRSGTDWVVTISVPPGVHHYAFRAADGTWFLPDSADNRVDDGFGGTNAVLVVPPQGSS